MIIRKLGEHTRSSRLRVFGGERTWKLFDGDLVGDVFTEV